MPGTSANTTERAMVVLALTILIALGTVVHAPVTAHAGWNSEIGDCIVSRNYADPASDYLYASTEVTWAGPEPCVLVDVAIVQGGCGGTVLAYQQATHYVSTSYSFPSQYWVNPCSRHSGEWEWHYLPFIY